MDERPESSEVQFVFTKPPDYATVFATGVWGGITPQGFVCADFFVETSLTPDTVAHALNADGTLGAEIKREPRVDGVARIERRLQVEVLLSPEAARSVAEWLLKRAGEAEAGASVISEEASSHDE